VPDFPNLSITHGPNCNLTANAAVIGEQQVHYIVELLQTMVDEAISAVEPDVEATRAYNEWTQEKLLDTAWHRKGKAHGYCRHDESGRIVIATPRHYSTVWHAMRRPNMDHFVVTRRKDARQRESRAMAMLRIQTGSGGMAGPMTPSGTELAHFGFCKLVVEDLDRCAASIAQSSVLRTGRA